MSKFGKASPFIVHICKRYKFVENYIQITIYRTNTY